MYIAMTCTIGCVPNSLRGRMRLMPMIERKVLSEVSHWVCNFSFPGTLRKSRALFPKIFGAYVSLIKKKQKIWIRASVIDVAWNIHRQVVP